ncbi:MAG: hypothetical protein NTW21_07470 [Verrucomicrobia bacterium]|nr:hypothetical protein [Verrucomicrobiota bacterium]
MEELGLWGYNTLAVWYDMHHFDGADDPRAVAFRACLHAVLQRAKDIGLDVALMVVANEAYGDSPAALRADPSAKRGGWYDCAVCPSKPAGLEYILKVLGHEFDWAADLQPRYVWLSASCIGTTGRWPKPCANTSPSSSPRTRPTRSRKLSPSSNRTTTGVGGRANSTA